MSLKVIMLAQTWELHFSSKPLVIARDACSSLKSQWINALLAKLLRLHQWGDQFSSLEGALYIVENWVRLVSSESFHWTRWIADMCPL